MKPLHRHLDLREDVTQKSLFLFGPRQTGKTQLLKMLFPDSPFYNLLLSDVYLRLSQRPQSMREEVEALAVDYRRPVIIDEIQKLPILLDEVQHLIEDKKIHFILTGSSARKLKHGSANLLGGRAWTRHLFPLVTAEIPGYDLMRILNYGALPSIYLSENPEEDLAAYVGDYLQEEIKAEGLTRKIENFSRFLQTASLCNAELVNFESVASDAQVPARTVRDYFSILEDTLIGSVLEPFTKTKKRKAIQTGKFYYFDVGVCNFLAGRTNIRPKTELFGKALEHFIFTELTAYLSYQRDRRPLRFWRSTSKQEVDFIIGDEVAIEVKGTEMVLEKHLTGLKALSEEISFKHRVVVSMDPRPRKIGNVMVMPVRHFLESLWGGQY